MRREKSLHRSDSFQTRQQFARESASLGYTSYAAALTGQQVPAQIPSAIQHQQGAPYTGYNPMQQGYMGYPTYSVPPYPPPQQVMYPYPPTMSTPVSSRDTPSSRPESGTSSPTTTRNDSPGFQPNPFAREFVPTGSSGTASVARPPAPAPAPAPPPPAVRPKESSTPPVITLITAPTSATTTIAPTVTSRHSTPPAVTPPQQVKKTASFENTAIRPITPTPIYTRSQSASSMRPPQQSYPPAYPPPYMIPPLPVPPPMLSTAPQRDWGPPITTGTIRYIANGQPSNPPPRSSGLMESCAADFAV